MKRLLLSIFLFSTLFSGVFALSLGEVERKIDRVQGSVPSSVPSAPSGYDQKGFVGEILSAIFADTGKIKSEYVNGFRNIMTKRDNIPKWDGTAFQQGTMWDKGGNIGIGNSNPQSKLHVSGNIISSNPTSGSHVTTKTYVDSTVSSAMSRVRAEHTRTINNLRTENNNTINNLRTENTVTQRTTREYIIQRVEGAGGKFVDGRNPIDAVYTPGKVGIGTTSPVQQLHTTGTARFDGGVMIDGTRAISTSNASHNAQYTNNSHYGYFEIRNASGQRGGYFGYGNGGDRINLHIEAASKLNISGGNVGIGVNDPSAKLQVNGDIKAISYLYSSDSTLKRNIQTTSGLDTISQLRGVDFIWKENNKKDIGFIAQEVEIVLPHLVQTDPVSGLKSVQYGNIIAPLVESVKELQERIEILESEISTLKIQ